MKTEPIRLRDLFTTRTAERAEFRKAIERNRAAAQALCRAAEEKAERKHLAEGKK